MPYNINAGEVAKLGDAMAKYYEDAWEAGVKSRFDIIARGNMGKVTAYLDLAKDSYADFRKKSTDSFLLKYRPLVKKQIQFYFANKMDVASDFVTIAEKLVVIGLKKIPVPLLGTVLGAAVSFAAAQGQAELRERSILEADKQIAQRTGSNAGAGLVNDMTIAENVKNALDQYKQIAKYVVSIPSSIESLDEAISYPATAWKVQQTVSGLNVNLLNIRDYVSAMCLKLAEVEKLSKEGIARVRTGMNEMVGAVLEASYAKGMETGKAGIAKKAYVANPEPALATGVMPGGASQLAAYVSHALAKGYYDAGNSGGPMTRPRR